MKKKKAPDASPEKKAHAVYSASGSYRWLACPGSIKLSLTAPPSADSKYAQEGTDAHTVLEIFLTKPNATIARFAAQEAGFPDAMIAHAEGAYRWIMERFKAAGNGAELLAETRADLSFLEPDTFGTADAVIIEPFGRLVVIDYKYGAGIAVSAQGDDGNGNPQLVYYALGVAHAHDYNFQEVELVIIQPRAAIDGEYIRSHVMSIESLLAWKDYFKQGIEACKEEDARLSSGDHCRFCPAAILCPEISNKALRQAAIDFDDEDDLKAVALPVPNSSGISLEKLPEILDAFPRLEKWMDAVRAYAFRELEAGRKIKGYALVEKRGQRKWEDIDEATESAIEQLGNGVMDISILSPAQIEKKFGERGRDFVTEYSVTVSSGLKLAPENDKKRESAEDAFS